MGMKRSSRLALALLCAVSASALPAGAPRVMPYTLAETGQKFVRLQDAVNAIGAGSGTITIAPLRIGDCAVQTAGDVAFIAEVPGKTIFDAATCEGKAALVLRGRSARVEGLVFANMRVPDANGAGIRLERGNLTISQAWFRDSEQGILTAEDTTGQLIIDRSTFTRLGRCDRGLSCAHSIYVGNYGALKITNSRFEAGRGGHYVKSRSRRVEVLDSSFDDSSGLTTNYMIDLPAGATGRIAGNFFVQGRNKENYSAFIAVAAEGKTHSANGLAIEANDARFAPGVQRASAFVADWSGDRLAIGTNTLDSGLKRYERR
jgi:hypothetical protein